MVIVLQNTSYNNKKPRRLWTSFHVEFYSDYAAYVSSELRITSHPIMFGSASVPFCSSSQSKTSEGCLQLKVCLNNILLAPAVSVSLFISGFSAVPLR